MQILPNEIQDESNDEYRDYFFQHKWGHYSLSNLTTLYDQEYMAGVREKLRFIKDMQAEQAKESVLE